MRESSPPDGTAVTCMPRQIHRHTHTHARDGRLIHHMTPLSDVPNCLPCIHRQTRYLTLPHRMGGLTHEARTQVARNLNKQSYATKHAHMNDDARPRPEPLKTCLVAQQHAASTRTSDAPARPSWQRRHQTLIRSLLQRLLSIYTLGLSGGSSL